MIKLQMEKISWLSDNDRLYLRETTDRLIRYTEDLDSVRDRAAVTQEGLVNRLSEQMNTRMYLLSLVAAVFLPLGFLTSNRRCGKSSSPVWGFKKCPVHGAYTGMIISNSGSYWAGQCRRRSTGRLGIR
jgi:hypothetical protein